MDALTFAIIIERQPRRAVLLRDGDAFAIPRVGCARCSYRYSMESSRPDYYIERTELADESMLYDGNAEYECECNLEWEDTWTR